MPKLHVAIDLDDVTLDFFQGVIDSMYREFGVMLLKEDVTTWDNNPVKLFDWKSHGYKSWWDWMKDHDWLWATFPAIPGAMGGIHALREQGHYVECVTSKPDWAEATIWTWMGRWKPEFQRVTITKLNDSKADATDAEILVDDKPQNILEWIESDEDRLGVLFDQPWNRGQIIPERVIRVATWEGVLEAVNVYEEA